MLVTEEEASKLWCVHGREVHADGHGGLVSSNHESRCLGAGCMSWRKDKNFKEVKKGWCGLAGDPR